VLAYHRGETRFNVDPCLGTDAGSPSQVGVDAVTVPERVGDESVGGREIDRRVTLNDFLGRGAQVERSHDGVQSPVVRDRISEIGAEVSRCDASAIKFPRGIPEEPGDIVPSVLGAAPSHVSSDTTSAGRSETESTVRTRAYPQAIETTSTPRR
jgi:hypothetical protein